MVWGLVANLPVGRLESQDLAPDLALPGPVIEIEQDDLLPGPQLEPAVIDGDAE